ncbi:MAG: hypothetical protein HC769_19160 [Cyanobacteria bacterium CRU_2_1]|nr:hypothetical protein [Cyanobacteria bacterium RU_5_0]NJR60755.1 hypothetical protein [Cyanobacteria bacterium CRU_2_1]
MRSRVLAGLLVFGSVWGGVPASAQRSIPQASASVRAEYRQQQEHQVNPDNYDLSRRPVTAANEDYWRNILWTTAIVEPQEDYISETIAQIISLTSRADLSNPQIRTVDMGIQVGTQLYLINPTVYANVGQQFVQTIEQSRDPIWVSMAFSALVQSGISLEERSQLSQRIQERFPRWTQDVHLYATLKEVENLNSPAAMPPLNELLNWSIAPRQMQMYVICRPDRGVLCQVVLKDANGEFVREDDKLWSVPLSLRSIHNLSWMFTRGQTPQGIYRIEGTVPQPDTEYFRAYGLFPLIKLFVPFEEGVREFVPGRSGTLTGNLTAYQALLPPSWRSYFPIQQTYWAGKGGRGLFRIHGTGDAPTFFTSNSRYPTSSEWNPTIGCLSALELYDDTGQLQQADMPKIIDALKSVGGEAFAGYLVVIDVPGSAPIALEEIEAAIALHSP